MIIFKKASILLLLVLSFNVHSRTYDNTLTYCPAKPNTISCEKTVTKTDYNNGLNKYRCSERVGNNTYIMNKTPTGCTVAELDTYPRSNTASHNYVDGVLAPSPIGSGLVIPRTYTGTESNGVYLIPIQSHHIFPSFVLSTNVNYPSNCTVINGFVSCGSPEPTGCHTDNTCPYPNDELDLSTGFILDNGGKCSIQGPTCFPVPAAWSNGCVPVHRNAYCDTIDVSDPNYTRPTDLSDPNDVEPDPPEPTPSIPNSAYPLNHSFQANGTPNAKFSPNTGAPALEYDYRLWKSSASTGAQHPSRFGCHVAGTCGGRDGVFANRRIDISTGYTNSNGWACTHKFPHCTEVPAPRSNGCIPHDMNNNCSSWYIRTNTSDCYIQGTCFGNWRNVGIDTSTGFATWDGEACTVETPNTCKRLAAPNTTGEAIGCIEHEARLPCSQQNDDGKPNSSYHLRVDPLTDPEPDPDPDPDPDGDNTFGDVEFPDAEQGTYGEGEDNVALTALQTATTAYEAQRTTLEASLKSRLAMTLAESTTNNDNFVTIMGVQANIGVSKWFPILDSFNFGALVFFSYCLAAFGILFAPRGAT